jgi:hypothetical protein
MKPIPPLPPIKPLPPVKPEKPEKPEAKVVPIKIEVVKPEAPKKKKELEVSEQVFAAGCLHGAPGAVCVAGAGVSGNCRMRLPSLPAWCPLRSCWPLIAPLLGPPCLLLPCPCLPCLQVVVCEGIVLEKCCPLPVTVISEKDEYGTAGTANGAAYDGIGTIGGTAYGTSGGGDTTGGAYGDGGGGGGSTASSTYGGDSSSSYDNSAYGDASTHDSAYDASYGKDKGGKKKMKKKKPVVIVKPLVCEVSRVWCAMGSEIEEGDADAKGGVTTWRAARVLVCGMQVCMRPRTHIKMQMHTSCQLRCFSIASLPDGLGSPAAPAALRPPQVVVKELVPVKAHFFL